MHLHHLIHHPRSHRTLTFVGSCTTATKVPLLRPSAAFHPSKPIDSSTLALRLVCVAPHNWTTSAKEVGASSEVSQQRRPLSLASSRGHRTVSCSSSLLYRSLIRRCTSQRLLRSFSFAALATPNVSTSTLHPGSQRMIQDILSPPLSEAPRRMPVVRNLDDRDAGFNDDGAPPKTRRQHRSFSDAEEVVKRMASSRVVKCPDAFHTTQLLIERLHFQPILDRLRFVHVAGTKGKGTTSAYTAALLKGYGFKVGLFTSPHLTDIRERIVVDGRLLDQNTYARYFFEFLERYEALEYSMSQLDRDIAAPSRGAFFRFMFLLALYIFDAESVDVAVMEVGIGGRLDSTNTIPSEVCIVTALGYDHMDVLGNSLDKIAAEKAGIMKPDVVCFAAPQSDHPETRKVLLQKALETKTPLVFMDPEVLPIRSWPRLAIGGVHMVENSKLAFMAARRIAGISPILPLDEVERDTLQTMTYAGRSQVVPVGDGSDMTVYMDGAHTPESITVATKWFIEASAQHSGDAAPRRVLLLYTSREPQRILKAFMPFVSHFSKVIMVPVSVMPPVPHSSDQKGGVVEANTGKEVVVALTESWRSLYREVPCLPCAETFQSFEDVLDLIVPAASDAEDASKPAQLFICGSFYLVGDMLTLLKTYESRKR